MGNQSLNVSDYVISVVISIPSLQSVEVVDILSTTKV